MLSSEKKPLVSVGIATYRRPKGLRRTLECITKQTYRNLEIIVSDNCSPGIETQEVMQEFMKDDPRIQFYRQKENVKALHGQFFISKVTGKYVMWATDDNWCDERYIEKCLNKMHGNTILCYSESMGRFPNGKVELMKSNIMTRGLNKVDRAKNILLNQRRNTEIFGLMKTSVIKDYNLEVVFGMDHILLFYLGLKGDVVKTDPGLFFTDFCNNEYKPKTREESLDNMGFPRSSKYFGYFYQMIGMIKTLYIYGDQYNAIDKLKVVLWILYRYFLTHHYHHKIRAGLKQLMLDLFSGRLWRREGEYNI